MKTNKEYFRNYYKQRRQRYYELLGNRCAVCGATSDLHFHHLDKTTKLMSIGKLMNYSEDKILNELKKCILLCKKCHIQQHVFDGTFTENKTKQKHVCGEEHPKARCVICLETQKQYGCISDCAKDMGFHPYKHHIYAVCSGKRKTYKGYHFTYVEEV